MEPRELTHEELDEKLSFPAFYAKYLAEDDEREDHDLLLHSIEDFLMQVWGMAHCAHVFRWVDTDEGPQLAWTVIPVGAWLRMLFQAQGDQAESIEALLEADQ